MATSNAPLSINTVTLIAKNRDKLAEFYRKTLGLNSLFDDGETLTLGQGDTPLLKLLEDRHAKTRTREAGLFHTAFLLPSRAHLGVWLRHAADTGIVIEGMADHSVSEAIYLSDPEGNGIEVYADRDRALWKVKGEAIHIDTKPLNTDSLWKASSKMHDWTAMPSGSVIGHVHLQVGDLSQADDFYQNELGFDRMMNMASASFYGSGGYHHHLAGNIWQSKGAGPRSEDTAGLHEIEIASDIARFADVDLVDPWGIRLHISQ